MKIGDARAAYSAKLKEYQHQKSALASQKKELEHKIARTPDGQNVYAGEAATLELGYNAVSEKYEEYHNFMEKLMEMHTALFSAETARQQDDIMAERTQDLMKLMEVARRIARGATVPGTDEQKLMEYSMEMYLAAKNMAVLNEHKDKEKYKSLWGDEEETEYPDAEEVANSAEVPMDAPDLVDVGNVMAAAGGGEVLE